MKVRAPGKLILSGEHAVVYGKPALAVAINRFAEAEAAAQLPPIISFDLGDLAYQQALRLASLDRLKERIKHKYRRFLRGEFKIRQVLKKPVELAQFALSLFFEMLNVRPTQGIKIKVQSEIPIGCGMGSSAAIILSVLHVIAKHLDLSLSPDTLFRMALEVENLQHGYSSGLDLRVSQQGGCLLMREGEVLARTVPKLPFYLINTGLPLSSTGECVAHAEPFFRQSRIGDDFATVTLMMDQSLQDQKPEAFQEAIRENHKLLINLGVVPEKVQTFVSQVEQARGAAKICGAGAVSGENAGVVLVVVDDIATLTDLCAQYRYSLIPASIEQRGLHVV
jgi:mevalonate kinase